MKKFFSVALVTLIFSCLAGSFMLSVPEYVENENRIRQDFPRFDIKKSFRRYFSRIDIFAVDHFPFRQHAIDSYRTLVNALGDQVDASRAFRGRDDFLFLGNHVVYNQSVDKLEGKIDPYAQEPILALAIKDLAQWFQSQGVKVFFMLAPNKSSVYPEKLPAIVKPSSLRYVDRSLQLLRDSGVAVIDPTEALQKRKQTDIVYYLQDTHWNQIGASVAVEQIMDAIGVHDCPAWSFAQDNDIPGDLVAIGAFESAARIFYDNFKIAWNPDATITHEVIEKQEIPDGQRTRFLKNSNAENKETIWIIGDSFSGNMLSFFSHCFARTGFFHFLKNSLDDMKNQYNNTEFKPSYLIIEVVERAF